MASPVRGAPPVPESRLEALFTKRVRLLGGLSIKLAPTVAGIPDRLVIFPGNRLFLVELKTTTGTLSPIQRAWHYRVAELGTPVHVLYGPDGVIKWLRAVVHHLDDENEEDRELPSESRKRTSRAPTSPKPSKDAERTSKRP